MSDLFSSSTPAVHKFTSTRSINIFLMTDKRGKSLCKKREVKLQKLLGTRYAASYLDSASADWKTSRGANLDREHQCSQKLQADQRLSHRQPPAHHQHRGDQLRSVWRIWQNVGHIEETKDVNGLVGRGGALVE